MAPPASENLSRIPERVPFYLRDILDRIPREE